MPFDAGAIKGTLDLDHTSFDRGFSEAHTHAETEGAGIREIAESLTVVFEEALGPAVGQVGQQLRSAFAGFSEGPIVGSLGLLATGLGVVREAAEGTAERFDKMRLEAQQVGLSVEYFSRLSAAAKLVDVDSQTLGTTMMMLNYHLGEVAQGIDKEGTAALARLGISTQDLSAHLGDTRWAIEAVISGLDRIPDIAGKTAVLRELLGRGGGAAINFFGLGGKEIEEAGDRAEVMGATVTAANAKTGESFKRLQVDFDNLFEGLSKDVGIPVLEYLQAHLPEIESGLVKFSKAAGADIEAAFKLSEAGWDRLVKDIHEIEAGKGPIGELLSNVAELVKEISKGEGPIGHIVSMLKEIGDDKGPIPALLSIPGQVGRGEGEIGWILHPQLSGFNFFGNQDEIRNELVPKNIRDASDGVAAGSSPVSLSIDSASIAAGVASAMDAHSATHANSGVADVLQSALDSSGSSSSGSAGRSPASSPSAGQTHRIDVTVNNNFDPHAAAAEVTRKILPAMQRASDSLKAGIAAANQRAASQSSMGGQ